MSRLSRHTQVRIYIAALIVRLLYVLAQHELGVVEGGFAGGDSTLYLQLAASVLAGHGLASGATATAFVSPGFPLFIAACQTLFGPATLWISLVQCFLGAAVCVFVANMAARIFG